MLFFPVKITDGPRSIGFMAPKILMAAWILPLLVASVVVVYKNWHGDVEIPTPVVYAGHTRNSWVDLEKVWRSNAPQRLPNLADYIAHRAFQAGLPYGMKYLFPTPNTAVYETQYRQEGNRIVSSHLAVEVFGEAWFKKTLSNASGIARMIERQPQVVVPTTRTIYEVGYPLSYLFVFWLAILAVGLPASFARRANRIESLARTATAVTTLPAKRPKAPVGLPEAPWRSGTRVGVGEPDLVSGSAGRRD